MPGTAHFPGLDWIFAGEDPRQVAEAVGHAWVQWRAGGSVTLVGADTAHPWWPVLRAWLPADAPLRLADSGAIEPLPQRPFPPVHLANLPRNGTAPWPAGSDPAAALAWLAEREPRLLLPTDAPHPALAIAWGAVASWGFRVCWRVADLAALEPAVAYIGVRQLPLHVVLTARPAELPERWWPTDHDQLALWLQHEWPTLYLPSA